METDNDFEIHQRQNLMDGIVITGWFFIFKRPIGLNYCIKCSVLIGLFELKGISRFNSWNIVLWINEKCCPIIQLEGLLLIFFIWLLNMRGNVKLKYIYWINKHPTCKQKYIKYPNAFQSFNFSSIQNPNQRLT